MTALVTDPIRWWALNTPMQPAIVFEGGDSLTFDELHRWTDEVARLFVRSGLEPGGRVGIVGNNNLEWCAAALGVLKAGGIVAAYNHRLVADELAWLVESSDPTFVLVGEEHVERIEEVAARGHTFSIVTFDAVRKLRDAAGPPFDRLEIDPDQPAVLVYTSGTASRPKGVVFTHRTIFSFIFEWGLMEPVLRNGVRMICVLSLGGAPGVLWSLIHMVTRGGTLFLEPGFVPAEALHRLEKERIEVMMGVPVLYEQIAALPEFATADLSGLSLATVGGARVPRALLASWLAKGVSLRQIYGMTELGGSSTATPLAEAATRPESAGRGSIFTRHRVVRPDGTDCEPGEPGEIIVRGPSVTPGYWHNDEATAEATREGWFHTGDVGVFDGDGYLSMVDRMKDMIITGGYNVAPSEIEAVIAGVEGVEEVAVISVDDAKFGETAAAIIRGGPELTAAAVVEHCNTRLAAYKVPRYVVFESEPLPRMPSGKVAKRALRETYGDLPSTHERVR